MAKPINVVIKGDYTDRDINRAIRDLDRLKANGLSASTGMAGLAEKMKNVLGPAMIAGAAAAGAAAVAFGVDAVKAFMDDERAAAALAKTLQNLGLEGATAAVESFVDAQQRATGVSDEQLRPAMDRLLRSTKNVQEAQDLMVLALNISAGSGKELEQVVQALSRAHDGNFGALGRLGTGLDAATLKSKNFDKVVANLSKTFEGQAAVAAETMSGKLQRLGVAADELKEALGRGIVEGFLDAMNDGMAGTNDLMRSMKDLEPITESLGRAIGKVAASLANTAMALQKVGGLFAFLPGPIKNALGFLFSFEGTISRIYRGLVALGIITSDTEDATRGYSSATVQAGISAGNARGSINDLTEDIAKSGKAAYTSAQSFADFFKAAANLSAAQALTRQLMNTSGTVGAALFKAAQEDLQKAADESDAALNQLSTSGGKAAEDLAVKWKDAAASVIADINVLTISFGGGGTVIAAGLVDAFQKRLEAFRGIVSTQTSIIKSAQDAIDSYSQSITDSIMGKINFSMTDPTTGVPLTPEQMVAMVLGSIENQQNAVAEIAKIATQIPPALTQQIMAMPPDAAIALAKHLAENPAMMEQLTISYQKLADFTKEKLGDPMALRFAEIGGESATKMIAEAKNQIDKAAEGFAKFVAAKLDTRITVHVDYKYHIGNPPGDSKPRALGGPVSAGDPFIVGERGPELFIPDVSGAIVPNHDLVGSGVGGSTFNITVNAGIGDPRAIGRSVVEAITLFERSSGPVFARA